MPRCDAGDVGMACELDYVANFIENQLMAWAEETANHGLSEPTPL